MSFFSFPPTPFKAQAFNRVEGFHPDGSSTSGSSTTTTAANNGPFGDLFSTTTSSGGGTMTTMNAHHLQQHRGFTFPIPFESSLRPRL